MLTAGVDGRQVGALQLVQRAINLVQDELGEANDGVKGRAQFVGYGSHKLVFQAISLFQLLVGCRQLAIQLSPRIKELFFQDQIGVYQRGSYHQDRVQRIATDNGQAC